MTKTPRAIGEGPHAQEGRGLIPPSIGMLMRPFQSRFSTRLGLVLGAGLALSACRGDMEGVGLPPEESNPIEYAAAGVGLPPEETEGVDAVMSGCKRAALPVAGVGLGLAGLWGLRRRRRTRLKEGFAQNGTESFHGPSLVELTPTMSDRIEACLRELSVAAGPLSRNVYRLPDGGTIPVEPHIGDPQIRIFSYAELGGICTPEEYYAFLVSRLSSPIDVARLIQNEIVEYKPKGNERFPLRKRFDPAFTLERGVGNCVDKSALATDALVHLGRRLGRNFKPRVLGQNSRKNPYKIGHAICVYVDEGQLFSLDQSSPKPFSTLAEASSTFGSDSEYRTTVYEMTEEGRVMRRSVDGSSFEPDFDRLTIELAEGETVNPQRLRLTSIVPAGFEWHKTTQVKIHTSKGDVELVFKQGDLYQITHEQGDVEIEFFENGRLRQQTLRSGRFKHIWYSRGGRKIQAEKFGGGIVRFR